MQQTLFEQLRQAQISLMSVIMQLNRDPENKTLIKRRESLEACVLVLEEKLRSADRAGAGAPKKP